MFITHVLTWGADIALQMASAFEYIIDRSIGELLEAAKMLDITTGFSGVRAPNHGHQ